METGLQSSAEDQYQLEYSHAATQSLQAADNKTFNGVNNASQLVSHKQESKRCVHSLIICTANCASFLTEIR